MYQTRNGYVGLGIVSNSVRTESKAYDKSNMMCYFADGEFRENGNNKLHNPKVPNKTILRVDVDMDSGEASWTMGGTVLKKAKISQNMLNDGPLWISVQMYYIGDYFKIA